MGNSLNREEVVKNFSQRALEGDGFGPVLEMGQERANIYRNYVTNRLIKKHLQLKKSDVVLDYGCGVGRVSRYLSNYCERVESVDASEAMIYVAQKKFTNQANVNYQFLPTQSLQFTDKSFDKIFTFWVLEHVGDDEVQFAINEFKRVLKPKGRIALFEQTVNKTKVYEDWSIQRQAKEYDTFAKTAGLKVVMNKPVLRNPSRGMTEWLRRNYLGEWSMPLLYQVDRFTIMRKIQYVEYFTNAVVLELP